MSKTLNVQENGLKVAQKHFEGIFIDPLNVKQFLTKLEHCLLFQFSSFSVQQYNKLITQKVYYFASVTKTTLKSFHIIIVI